MYLLIPVPPYVLKQQLIIFTFHNVSINSERSQDLIQGITHLHSIMYLLIQVEQIANSIKELFTFHNVSINSILCYVKNGDLK